MTLRVKGSSLLGTCFFFGNFITVPYLGLVMMKLNVIITCFVFSFSMFYLAISFFFLKFSITFTISFRRKKNRSYVMTNFIFCLSTSHHRLNKVDLQELWHCDMALAQ